MGDFIHGGPKDCNVEMMEDLVVSKDILLIRSLVVSQSNTDDKHCCSYKKWIVYSKIRLLSRKEYTSS